LLTKTLNTNNLEEIAKLASKHLLAKSVIILPTETVYGLITLWNNPIGYKKIFQLKKRPKNKHLQMLAQNLSMAEHAGIITNNQIKTVAQHFFPGELTIICPAKNSQTIGLRIPNSLLIQAILKKLNQPLAATSANLSGMPPASTAQEAIKHLAGKPTLLIDGGKTSQTASTVLSMLTATPKILRNGKITQTQIQQICNQYQS